MDFLVDKFKFFFWLWRGRVFIRWLVRLGINSGCLCFCRFVNENFYGGYNIVVVFFVCEWVSMYVCVYIWDRERER